MGLNPEAWDNNGGTKDTLGKNRGGKKPFRTSGETQRTPEGGHGP